MLSGCAEMNLSSQERWAIDNTFYSTKLPAIKFVVSDDFTFASSSGGNLAPDTTGQSQAGKDIAWYNLSTA